MMDENKPLDIESWMPNNEFLSCREVINWIAFGIAEDTTLMYHENSDDCSSELLFALTARAAGRALWVPGEPPLGTPSWMFEQKPSWVVETDNRVDQLMKRTGKSAEDLATSMRPKVQKMEKERTARAPVWDSAKEKFLKALAQGLRAHPRPNTQAYEGRTSPGLFLSAEIGNPLLLVGWYLKDDVVSIWPILQSGTSTEATIVKKQRGPKPIKQLAIEGRMREAIREGLLDLRALDNMPIKLLIHTFNGAKTTCVEARKAVLSDFTQF